MRGTRSPPHDEDFRIHLCNLFSIYNFRLWMYCRPGCQRAEKIFCALNWVLCSVCWDTVGKFNKENYLGKERKGEIIKRLKRFLFMMGVLYTFGNVSCLNLGQRIHCEMTSSWLSSSNKHTNMSRGIHPSSAMFLPNGSNSIMSQHVCVCLSIL